MSQLRTLLSALFLFGSMTSAGLAGCSSTAGDPCKGGVVKNGICEAKCDASKCVANNVCVDNACTLECTAHTDCSTDGSQKCLPGAVEDTTKRALNTCRANPKPGFGAPCPIGTECAAGLRCLTTGLGDADAYCTNDDCAADTDCAPGFYCGITHDPHGLCGSATVKGNNNLCGKTTEPCIAAGDLAAKHLTEGPGCLLRNTCLARELCAPCTTDVDCSLRAGQRCVAIGGSNHCAHTCARDGDCDRDAKCTDGACIPRGGACKGGGKFCDACLDDRDCGPNGTVNACVTVDGAMRGCFDLAFTASCMGDTDCPTSPGGLHGICLDEDDGVMSDNSVYKKCYLPKNAASLKSTCW